MMGNEMYCPLHATRSKNPNCSFMSSLFEPGMLVSHKHVCLGLVPHGLLMLRKNLWTGVLVQYFLYLGSYFCCRTKALLSCLTKWTTSRNGELMWMLTVGMFSACGQCRQVVCVACDSLTPCRTTQRWPKG